AEHAREGAPARWTGFSTDIQTDIQKGAAMHSLRRNEAEPDERESDYTRFVALVPEHMEAVVRVAAALVGAADAEDAAQEAVVRAWRAWTALRDPAAMRPWLLRIAVNVCHDWRRGSFGVRQRLTGPLEDAEGFAAMVADPGALDVAAALDLREAVNRLDPDLRVVVALRYYAGMDATEIGAALDIPPATVRTRLRRALHTLRDRLQAADAESLPAAAPRTGGR
ncbi:MAG: RNA polymerase sigma factor, partial [Ktedonobacterales bacterium]